MSCVKILTFSVKCMTLLDLTGPGKAPDSAAVGPRCGGRAGWWLWRALRGQVHQIRGQCRVSLSEIYKVSVVWSLSMNYEVSVVFLREIRSALHGLVRELQGLCRVCFFSWNKVSAACPCLWITRSVSCSSCPWNRRSELHVLVDESQGQCREVLVQEIWNQCCMSVSIIYEVSVIWSFILGDSNWTFFQVGYPVGTPTELQPWRFELEIFQCWLPYRHYLLCSKGRGYLLVGGGVLVI